MEMVAGDKSFDEMPKKIQPMRMKYVPFDI